MLNCVILSSLCFSGILSFGPPRDLIQVLRLDDTFVSLVAYNLRVCATAFRPSISCLYVLLPAWLNPNTDTTRFLTLPYSSHILKLLKICLRFFLSKVSNKYIKSLRVTLEVSIAVIPATIWYNYSFQILLVSWIHVTWIHVYVRDFLCCVVLLVSFAGSGQEISQSLAQRISVIFWRIYIFRILNRKWQKGLMYNS